MTLFGLRRGVDHSVVPSCRCRYLQLGSGCVRRRGDISECPAPLCSPPATRGIPRWAGRSSRALRKAVDSGAVLHDDVLAWFDEPPSATYANEPTSPLAAESAGSHQDRT